MNPWQLNRAVCALDLGELAPDQKCPNYAGSHTTIFAAIARLPEDVQETVAYCAPERVPWDIDPEIWCRAYLEAHEM